MQSNKMQIHQSKAEPWRITLIDTGENTMTGGRLKRVRPYLGEDDFCFTYGDGVSDVNDVNVADLIAFHQRQKTLATLTAVHPPARFGKAKSRLNWQPKWSLERALKETVSWYKAYQLNQDMQAFTLKQIAEYIK